MSIANTTPDRLAFSLKEFLSRNGISRASAYREISSGRLHARKLGAKTLIFAEDEIAWRNSLPVLVSARDAR